MIPLSIFSHLASIPLAFSYTLLERLTAYCSSHNQLMIMQTLIDLDIENICLLISLHLLWRKLRRTQNQTCRP